MRTTSSGVVSRLKWRIKLQCTPSVAAWNAKLPGVDLEIRSQVPDPSTSLLLASSETPLVTTETTIGCPAGENSRHSLAHDRSLAQTNSTPASNVEANSTSTSALS